MFMPLSLRGKPRAYIVLISYIKAIPIPEHTNKDLQATLVKLPTERGKKDAVKG